MRYCASKFAVQGLTEALRKELVATKIRVTSICPGSHSDYYANWISSGLVGNTEFSLVRLNDIEKAQKVYEGIEPLKPEDVADSIVYIASRFKFNLNSNNG